MKPSKKLSRHHENTALSLLVQTWVCSLSHREPIKTRALHRGPDMTGHERVQRRARRKKGSRKEEEDRKQAVMNGHKANLRSRHPADSVKSQFTSVPPPDSKRMFEDNLHLLQLSNSWEKWFLKNVLQEPVSKLVFSFFWHMSFLSKAADVTSSAKVVLASIVFGTS